MKKLLLLSALLIFACSSKLFCQDYMKMNKKNLRIEYQKKLNQIDSLKQVLDLTYSKNQNLQSNLNNANNDLLSISDSLKNSNLEISQLEVKLLNSKNELNQLGLEIDNLVKQNSNNLDLITDKNLQIDSLRNSLNIASDEKSDLISQNSLKTRTIDSLKIENEVLMDKLNEEKNKFICNEEQPKYEDYGDDECEYIIREKNCVLKNLLINTKNSEGTCGVGGTDISWNSRYFEIVNSEILKEKNLQTFFRNPDILLNIINSQFEFEFFKLYESNKDCFDESFYKKRDWSEIDLRINSDEFLFYTWNYSVKGYCESSIGELKFTIDTNNLLKFIKVRELEDLSLNKLLENWESKVIDNKNQLEDNNKFKEIDIAQWVGITLLPLNSCVSKIDVYETAFFDFFKGYNDGKYYLGAFEIAYEIQSILYNQFLDTFTVNLSGKVEEEGDEYYIDPFKLNIKRLNGKFYIDGKTQPYVACRNVEQVWGMD